MSELPVRNKKAAVEYPARIQKGSELEAGLE
jgi:hypothetical protein